MKTYWPLFIAFIFISNASAVEVANSTMDIMNDPLVKPHYSKCVAKKLAADELSDCIWKELSKNPQAKDQVVKKYFSTEQNADRYSSMDSKTITSSPNEAIEKLEEYMGKKLQEAMYGAVKEAGVTTVADHQVFYKLYQNQVSKNIITSISSYCIEADSIDGLPIISKDAEARSARRKANIDSLGNFSNNGKQEVNEAYASWEGCLRNLNNVCNMKVALTDENLEDKKYSQKRACVLTNYLKQLRQSLIIASDIQKQMSEDGEALSMSANNVKVYTGKSSDDQPGVNELTTISSNEFINTSGYKDSLEAQKNKIDQCIKSGNPEMCKEFLTTPEKKKQLDDAIAEYDLEKRAMQEKLSKMDAAEIEKFLKDEGRTEDEIKRMLASDESINSIKEQINANFDAERKAVITAMKAKVNSRSVSSVEDGAPNIDAELNKLKVVQQELADQGEAYQQLVHYNNIVSSFLTVVDDNDKAIGSNIVPLTEELKDSAYSDKNRGPASSSSVNGFNELSNKLQEFVKRGNAGGDDAKDVKPLDTDVLNQNIFKYDLPEEKK